MLLAATARARAQEVEILSPPSNPEETHSLAATLALGAAGVLSGFLFHESGHVIANLMLGNVPHLKGTMTLGFIPFFVINPGIRCTGDHCIKRNGHTLPLGRNGSFLIDTAGFEVQHIINEFILSLNPTLAEQYAPYQQGLLAFNIFLSALYASAGLTGLEDPHGDLRTASDRMRINERLAAVFLLIPAGLDVYRFFRPNATWAVWASRGTKTAMLGITFIF